MIDSFRPDSNVNYDPFTGLSENARKEAIGGITGARVYYKLIITQLAQALNDENARRILHQVVPTWDHGEVRIAQTAIAHPDLLTALSANFKAAIDGSGLSNQLAQKALESQFDAKALLQVTEAMFDLEVTLVNPAGQSWDGSQAIPVFYIPIDDETLTIVGVDPSLNVITMREDITPEELPYSFLSVNFDEDTPETGVVSSIPSRSRNFNIWEFFVSSAYAHSASPTACTHQAIIAPALQIVIDHDHEPGFWNDPEIEVRVHHHSNLTYS